MVKPGYKTSEFWFTLVSFIFSGLYLVGILQENAQKEQLIEIVSHGVESVILIGGQVLILYKYIKGRNEVKKSYSANKEKATDDKHPTRTKRKVSKTNRNKSTKSK